MIMLLREPHLFTKEELRLAAERAWHISFDGGSESMHCVAQSGEVTLLKAGTHLLNFFYYPKPYVDKPGENIDWLPHVSQQHAWAQHLACYSVDYMNSETDLELGYCVLAKLVAELLDGNCTAVYAPRISSLIPNDPTLYLGLQRTASFREAGIAPTR
jgi:hypothetical protein